MILSIVYPIIGFQPLKRLIYKSSPKPNLLEYTVPAPIERFHWQAIRARRRFAGQENLIAGFITEMLEVHGAKSNDLLFVFFFSGLFSDGVFPGFDDLSRRRPKSGPDGKG